jgi:GNAT superfamily N-acetyltransferase
MVKIREATIDDKEAVFDLLRQLMSTANEDSPINQASGDETFQAVIEGNQGDVLLAEEDGTALGLCTLAYPVAIRCGGSYASIEEFIVNEAARGKGVGGKLLEASIDLAKSRGCREMVVNRPSDLGLPVYLRHGWKDAGKCLLMQPVRSAINQP